MNAQTIDKDFYEKKWESVNDWSREKSPYLKKSVGIEGEIALKWAKKYVKLGKVIDIGCGGGRNAILFSLNGFDSIGIDFSANAIKLAKQLAKEKESKAKFFKKSILDNCDLGIFDLALDFGCFHHLRKNQWKKYINNISKIIKPKGHYILYTFSKESKETGNYKKGKDYSIRNGHYNHYFSIDELISIFCNNFKIIKSKTIKEKGRLLAFNILLFQKLSI